MSPPSVVQTVLSTAHPKSSKCRDALTLTGRATSRVSGVVGTGRRVVDVDEPINGLLVKVIESKIGFTGNGVREYLERDYYCKQTLAVIL